MLRHPEITLKRAKRFLAEFELNEKLYHAYSPVRLSVNSTIERVPYEQAVQGSFRPVQPGEQFGPLWSTHWFKVQAEIPPAWAGHEVHLLWDSCSEACVWIDGQPVQGLTGSANGWLSTYIRKDYRLAHRARGGEPVEVYIEIACNGLFGVEGGVRGIQIGLPDAIVDQIGILRQAELAIFNRNAWDLYWDLVVITDMARLLPTNTPRAGQALAAVNAILNAVTWEDCSSWSTGRQIATRFLSQKNGDGQHNLTAVGHAHIDSAWLWPVAETKRKCVRTFTTALSYMEDYPEYKFACSQAAQYEWMKQIYPALYDKIKAKVHAGQFIPVGGTWVEPDCNIPSGESLIRQFYYGQRFFQGEFGRTCREFWSPDGFGYSAALPQILAQVGIRYFFTSKLRGNEFNQFPAHSFIWEGIDGSRVYAHFPPAGTYCSFANVEEVLDSSAKFKDHDRARESLLPFGFGDGGAGPTRGMFEQLRRMADVDGLPRTQIRSPEEFFDRFEADLRDPLVWTGELYFEKHRGVYTTQAANKRYNRKSEFALRDLEFLSAVDFIGGGNYPADEIEQLWKTVLFNQFHDIIPGSSIHEVYTESHAEYRQTLERCAALQDASLQSLVGEASGQRLCAVNTLPFRRTEVVVAPDGMFGGQPLENGRSLAVISAPPMGYAITDTGTGDIEMPAVKLEESGGAFILDNGVLRATLTKDGHLVSLVTLADGREAIAPGQPGNHFVIFDDLPYVYDAWDVDVYHLEKRWEHPGAAKASVVENGPLRAAIGFLHDLSPTSMLRQTISLNAGARRLDFDNVVDWNEKNKFLKVEFPLNIRAQHATYEIQMGHVQRPTHFNTSWDVARFEVCAHKWADLSEPGFGLALLNDCKYGYAVHGSVMRLSLLRAPMSPDPQADIGQHEFAYALFPHTGSLQSAGVIEESYRFNSPLIVRSSTNDPGEVSYFQVNQPALMIEAVKRSEDGQGIILHLYEAHGSLVKSRLTSCLQVRKVELVNLLEEVIAELPWEDGGVSLDLHPHQIVALKLSL